MYLVDSGPVLKFFATNNERWLFAALAGNRIHAPEAVKSEVFSVPQRRRQFERAPRVWQKVEPRLITVLPDASTPELEKASRDVLRRDLRWVTSESEDLGERMALLHASLAAQAGADVVLLCDDAGAQALIRQEARRLQQLRYSGSIDVVDTVQVLWWAIEAEAIPDRAALRAGYARMAALDESLPKDVKAAGLLKRPPW